MVKNIRLQIETNAASIEGLKKEVKSLKRQLKKLTQKKPITPP